MIWNYASHPSDRICLIACVLCILLSDFIFFRSSLVFHVCSSVICIFLFNELDYVCNGAVSL